MCGILAFIGKPPDADALAEALQLIRHRGQDGLGVWHCQATASGHSTMHYRQTRRAGVRIARDLPDADHLVFVAHWRYATRGGGRLDDVHPILIDGGDAAIAHNGQFQFRPNGGETSVSDTRLFARRVERDGSPRLVDRIFAGLEGVGGAFALVAADSAGLVTARDRFGIRPLFGSPYRGGMAFSSEMPALRRLGCFDIAEVPRGSVTGWSACGAEATRDLPAAPLASCSFESIYFHAAEGRIRGQSVDVIRQRLGRELARECPAVGDLVAAVPQSGSSFARGFAAATGLPLKTAISLSPDAGRTFIEGASSRAEAIRRKYVFDPAVVSGRAVVVIDDSLVRGATMGHVTGALRAAGARQVHARIGSPQFAHPCFFGIDVPDRAELVCEGRGLAEVATLLGLDSLGFLSLAGLHRVLGQEICTGCFSGLYPEGALSPRLLLPGGTLVPDSGLFASGEDDPSPVTRKARRLAGAGQRP